MGRSDYSTEASTQADESTYASSVRESTAPPAGDATSADLPRYATHKPSRAKKANINISGLNRRLRTEFIDVDPNDESIGASLIRGIVGLVGSCFTPRQILVALRLLKAITVAFIALTAAANMVYISCVEFVSDPSPNPYFGHRRDTVLRLYGLAFAILALLIELDKFVMKNFKVLKGFLARFGLLFFVAMVSYCHPAQFEDDYNNGYDSGIPMSAVVFQMVASSVLACCSFAYLLFGLLCFDRFTSRAFLSTQDPVASTAIPSGHDKYESPSIS
mmetsp:Transcript_20551/g.37077  ORF Transcript_20551/g.37077 Transcript_20551/m.37077 type:complete len:275 (-) Transcript_20551:451-1275(-)|eukprot:CAMPEP_0201897842 /NCGR_PEP_ID=MMETSP0902-20130614/47392_1 /ASSEMBLY_ACC=CAM_ASM_000551 /TAXON_ID=420261 /ORGANISM="Thalassiosira antarctica, Strain CCMP982" /LENGTH=274 /DNA_ID=CAMNT_0048430819 /DNA_START=211 /DNA_END=1035 /DNA_ORIENTATION=+